MTFAEDLGEGDHFHESQADDGSFGVVSAEETVAEARSHRYDVLRRRQGGQGAGWGRPGQDHGFLHSPRFCSGTMSKRDERRGPFSGQEPRSGVSRRQQLTSVNQKTRTLIVVSGEILFGSTALAFGFVFQ